MRYVEAKLTEKTHALIYRIYVTDALQAMTNNTGQWGGGSGVKKRYYDIYREVSEPQKIETRTSEDIVNSLKEKMAKLKG